MNQEERQRERELRNEAKEKKREEDRDQKEGLYWRVLDVRLRKWYIQKRQKEKKEMQEIWI